MTEKNFNMQSFSHSILLDKSPADVYKYIGTGNGLTKWFLGETVYTAKNGNKRDDDEFIKAGDEYYWHWLEKDLSITGQVIEAEKDKFIKFTFGSIFNFSINVSDSGSKTLLTLKQEYINGAAKNDFAHINCCVCWVFFMTNLKSVIEYGNDLREVLSDNEELVNR